MTPMNIPTEYLIYPVFVLVGLLAGWLLRGRRQTAVSDRATFEDIMRRWEGGIKIAEGSALNNLAATTPYLATAIPASIAYKHMTAYLDFGPFLALVAAVCIEFLGLAAVHTSFQLWDWNEQKNQTEQEAPIKWAIISGVVYLFIVIMVNVILESANVQTWSAAVVAEIVSKALLSLLSVVAAFVLALRSQHARRLALKEQKTQERRDANELGRLRKMVGELETVVAGLKDELQAERDGAAALELSNIELRERAEKLQDEVGVLRENTQKLQGELTAVSAKSTERNTQNTDSLNGKVSNNLPGDWRKLNEAQIRELAVLSREEREKRFPKLKSRTRLNWHERLDEAKEKYAQESAAEGEWGTW